jgi:regulator of sigma E protease
MHYVDLIFRFVAVPVVMLTVLVFVHEFGHYWVARRNGVRVDIFSIGFGPELFGWYDEAGTRWRVSAIPLGGYVKMFGDADAASRPAEGLAAMGEAERAVAFHHKPLGARAAVIAAGPAANFLFAIVALAILFMIVGQPFTPPVIDQVVPDGAASAAGMLPGDRVIELDGKKIERFEDIQEVIVRSPGVTLHFTVQRGDEKVQLTLTPREHEVTDPFGKTHTTGFIGVSRGSDEYVRRNPIQAVWAAVGETFSLSVNTLRSVWEMITGARGTDELGGPIGIAQISGQVAKIGLTPLIWLTAVLSINLGLINLFPIPVLDGGHLLFYAFEAIRGRPLGEKAQEYGFRIGLALVLSLMVFATRNDLFRNGLVDFVRSLL